MQLFTTGDWQIGGLEMNNSEATRIQAVIDGVDNIAKTMELKWGVGRLRLVVSDDLREKFDRQYEKLNGAIWAGVSREVEIHGPGMIRAWQALDAAATAAGELPLDPVVWETVTESGTVLAVVRTNADAHAVVASGRAVDVWTMEEVGRMAEASGIVAKIKTTFPGAKVTRILSNKSPDDGIADFMM